MANGSAYLGRTISSGSTTTKATFSCWLRRCDVTSNIYHGVFGMKPASSSNEHLVQILLQKNDNGAGLQVAAFDSSGSTSCNKRTERALRDVTAWYHIVVTMDTTLATAEDRCKIYINGERETDFVSGTNTNFAQNDTIGYFNNHSNNQQLVGAFVFTGTTTITNKLNGSLAHVHACDGYAYQASSFGETDATTGIWKPKTSPTVNYGTNGFFLKMDNSGNMGLDSSGNSNSLTTNGTIIQTKDTPTNVFANINSLFRNRFANTATLTNVNSTMTTGPTDGDKALLLGTHGFTKGKWYWECKVGTNKAQIGFAKQGISAFTDFYGSNNPSRGFGVYGDNGNVYYDGNNTAYGSSWTTNDIIMVALDMDNKLAWLGKNGTWFNSATQTEIENGTATNDLTTKMSTQQNLTGATIFPMFADQTGLGDMGLSVNFGNGYFGTTAVTSAQNPDDGIGIFEYDVPAGYRAICTKSINAEEYS